jgi:O-antigen/teichoic acid export membrane protein
MLGEMKGTSMDSWHFRAGRAIHLIALWAVIVSAIAACALILAREPRPQHGLDYAALAAFAFMSISSAFRLATGRNGRSVRR